MPNCELSLRFILYKLTAIPRLHQLKFIDLNLVSRLRLFSVTHFSYACIHARKIPSIPSI